jgi:ATP-dependent Clp protease ATP-binding subunit ClpA
MFNRFTLPALQVLFHARSEVSTLRSRAIEPEHILLGILDETTGLGRRVLAQIGDVASVFTATVSNNLRWES